MHPLDSGVDRKGCRTQREGSIPLAEGDPAFSPSQVRVAVDVDDGASASLRRQGEGRIQRVVPIGGKPKTTQNSFVFASPVWPARRHVRGSAMALLCSAQRERARSTSAPRCATQLHNAVVHQQLRPPESCVG
jgi:hypothetical protein